MENPVSLAIEFKFGDIMPWTVVYITSQVQNLMSTYDYLTTSHKLDPLYHYRCCVLVGGRSTPFKV